MNPRPRAPDPTGVVRLLRERDLREIGKRGITKTATMDVTIINSTTGSFTSQMVSGKAFFEETINPGGSLESSLSIFNSDFSFIQYTIGGHSIGTWSLDSSTEIQVQIDDGTGTPSRESLEKIEPVDPAKLYGTYVNQIGETWIFNVDGTGSTTGAGGWTFGWTVDSGILKLRFSSGYEGRMYVRANSQCSSTSYTMLKWVFIEYTPSGGFYGFNGGMDLTRQ
jgi:hypothetical protein